MEKFVKGDVIVLPFPFSDLSSTKKRPALVIADIIGDDYILAQITSANRLDEYAISLEDKNFESGKLPQSSLIRVNKLFTADKSLILNKVGKLKENKITEVIDNLLKIFK